MATEDLLHSHVTDEIVEHLRAGTNVNLVGMRASGRSATLCEVVDRLTTAGIAITRIAGVGALRDRPLSALAVAGIEMVSSPNNLNMLMSAVTDLEDVLSSRPSVLVIDDADDLDASTIGAVAAVHARLRTPVVITSRPTGCRRSEAGALIAELQPGVRIALPPLPFEDIHRLIHQLLGGPVEPMTVARIAAKSGGLPGLVSAMIRTGRASSRLAPRGGLWVSRGDLWTTPLAQSVEPFLAELDEPSLDAITVLSHAGPLSMTSALRLVTPESLSSLDDLGLLSVVPEGSDAVVSVFPPLVAEYMTHEGSTTSRMLVRGRLATAHSTDPQREIPAGQRTRPSTAPVLNRRMSWHWQHQLNSRRAAWELDPTPATAAPLLEALLVTRALPHEIDAVIAATEPSGTDEQAAAIFVVWSAISDALACGRLDSAHDLLRANRNVLPTLSGLLIATELHIELLTTSAHRVALRAELARSSSDGEDLLSQDSLLVVQADALVTSGQAHAALDLLDGFSTDNPFLARSVEVTRELAQIYTCDIEKGIAAALTNVERSRLAHDAAGVEAHAYVAGLGLAFRGRLVELDELTAAVLALSPMPVHLSHVQTGLLSLAADVAKWQGRRSYANSLALQATGLLPRQGPHPGMSSHAITLHSHDGDDDKVANELWAIAEERLEHGFLPAGIVAGVSAVERRPDAERAAQLTEAAALCDSPLLGHLAAYATAIASSDPAELAALEPRLLQAGLRLYAVRTAVARSVAMLASGDVIGAVEQADDAWNKAGLRGRDLCGLFRRFDRAVSLTAREREVAVLVARGMSSQEIADLKVLSVRTVENHVFSACRKVGVDTREGLAHAAQTWLSCAIE